MANKTYICIDIRNVKIFLLMSLLGSDPTDILGSSSKLVRGIEFSVTLLPMKNIFNPSTTDFTATYAIWRTEYQSK